MLIDLNILIREVQECSFVGFFLVGEWEVIKLGVLVLNQ